MRLEKWGKPFGKGWVRQGGCAVVAALWVATGVAAPAAADTTEEKLAELVEILRAQGVIDDTQYAEMADVAAKKDDAKAWYDRFSVWADFRARYEGFFFEKDAVARATNNRLPDRHRARYRARINLRGEVNSRAAVYLRLASGGDDPRSTNQTLGSGNDFSTDDIRFDLAYATLTPFPDGELPGIQDGYLGLDVGKVKNPFLWKKLGQDKMLWDGDITLEGANLRVRGGSGPLGLFANTGIYIIDENSSAKDPKLFAAQLGSTLDVAEHVSAGARTTLYHFFKLDDSFYGRAASNPTGPGGTGGNIIDGLNGQSGSIQVLEASAFVGFDCWDLFPVKIFGGYAHNLSARSSLMFPGVANEDDAFNVGVLVGDKVRLVRLGAAYYHIEANAFPSMFLDSDLFDGFPNRRGWAFTAERQLLEGVVFALTTFVSRRIEEGSPAFDESVLGSDRVRVQADLNFAL